VPELEVGGRVLHYLDEGSGDPPVVLLHAFPLRAAMWEPQLIAWRDRYRVVAPDLPGFGGSDPPDDPARCSMGHYADGVLELAGTLGLGPFVLVGLSIGGYIAFEIVRRAPAALAGLVLADTRPGADSLEVMERRSSHQRELREGVALASLGRQLVGGLVAPGSADRERMVREGVAMAVESRREGWIAALEAMKGRPDSTEDLAQIRAPTLVVVGEHDSSSPPEVAGRMCSRIPGAHLTIIPRAGHLSSMENPEAFNRAVGDFVAEAAARG
jgi:pimeloyl-ACP methyl ester carboxylesterase